MTSEAPTTVPAMCQAIIQSRLLSDEQVEAIRRRFQAEKPRSAENLKLFASWLLSTGQLTEYQIRLLLAGHVAEHILGDYTILDRLGQGRMAGVYKAHHRLGQTVAIKVLPPSRTQDPKSIGRFRREARLALLLKHPNIIRTFQSHRGGPNDDLYYIVMELLEGESLEEILQRRVALPVDEAVRLVCQALQGLQHIHEHDMVHRDLMPANLMVIPGWNGEGTDSTLEATVKIVEIGLGRSLFDENASQEENAFLTQRSDLLGNPTYIAPEQARDAHKADIRADIYSLGCVLYHALTGRPPFQGKSYLDVISGHLAKPPTSPRKLQPDIPEQLDEIVLKMLEKDPALRYAAPIQAARALEQFLTQRRVEVGGKAEATSTEYLSWLDKQRNEGDEGDEDDEDKALRAARKTAVARREAETGPTVAAAPAAVDAGYDEDALSQRPAWKRSSTASNETGTATGAISQVLLLIGVVCLMAIIGVVIGGGVFWLVLRLLR